MTGQDRQDAKREQQSELSFEQSLAELQQIVSQLEDGALGLEDSMRRFEHGIELLRRCYGILEQAEQKIEVLTGVDEQGKPLTAPFDKSATMQPGKPTAGRRRRQPREQPAPQSDEPDEDEPPETPPRLF